MSYDTIRSAGPSHLAIETADGWAAVLSVEEIESIRGRREGGCAVHTVSGQRPILLDVPVREALAVWKEVSHE